MNDEVEILATKRLVEMKDKIKDDILETLNRSPLGRPIPDHLKGWPRHKIDDAMDSCRVATVMNDQIESTTERNARRDRVMARTNADAIPTGISRPKLLRVWRSDLEGQSYLFAIYENGNMDLYAYEEVPVMLKQFPEPRS